MGEWIEVAVRASSIKDLLDCALRWKAKQLDGKKMPYSVPAWLGTVVHDASAVFDSAKLTGSPIKVDDAIGAVAEKIQQTPEEGINWSPDDLSQNEARVIGSKLIANYCADIAPQRNYVAVEKKAEKMVVSVESERVRIILTGTVDRIRSVVKHDGVGFGISDIKSGAQRVSKEGVAKSKADKAQLGVYELLAEHATEGAMRITEPAELIGMNTNGVARVGFGTIEGTRAALVGQGDIPGTLDYVARILRAGLFPPNPGSMMCHEKYCPIYQSCPYHD